MQLENVDYTLIKEPINVNDVDTENYSIKQTWNQKNMFNFIGYLHIKSAKLNELIRSFKKVYVIWKYAIWNRVKDRIRKYFDAEVVNDDKYI